MKTGQKQLQQNAAPYSQALLYETRLLHNEAAIKECLKCIDMANVVHSSVSVSSALRADGTPVSRRLDALPWKSAWCEPLIIRRWQRVALRLDAAVCEAVAAALPAVASGSAPMRYLGLEQATEGWALGTGGMAPAESRIDGTDRRAAPASLPAHRQERPSTVHSQAAPSDAWLAI